MALLIPGLIVALGMCLPAVYLLARAFEADTAQLTGIVFRQRNLYLLGNTLKLVGLVLALSTLIALPMAWLVTRSDLPARRAVTFLMVAPLAVPGYVMAYALLGLSGYYGFARHWFGVTLPPMDGLWGAGLALSLYTFPYLFLALRAAFLGIDPGLEESAQSLGQSRWKSFRRVLLPQLMPALAGGWLVIGLYVIGDFGAIALMRYEVFSYAIYTQYSSAFDRSYAAWLSLMLLALTILAVQAQAMVTQSRRLSRTGTGTARRAKPVPLGIWRLPALALTALVVLASLGLPLMVLGHWMRLGLPGLDGLRLLGTAWRSLTLAAPAAVLVVALALPVVILVLRYPSRGTRLLEKLAYLGYATPSLAFALAMVFFALRAAPWLYQSLALLIFAYVMSFLALAFGPIRLALLQIGTRQEEAARALGAPPGRAFLRIVLPRLGRPMLAGGLLVFVMIVKELPMTMLLAPTGYTTLATNIFARTNEGMMAEAAPFALLLIGFSALFIGLMLGQEDRRLATPAGRRPG